MGLKTCFLAQFLVVMGIIPYFATDFVKKLG